MRIQLAGITKRFGSLVANDRITLDIPVSTIQGILGENGAGKSTLMKILSGYQRPDEGRILLDGREVTISSPKDALSLGIGMLHQDPLDFPTLTALDNYLLGDQTSLIPDRKKAARKFAALNKELGFSLDPGSMVGELTVGERQQLEILRLLASGAKTLILDEPTTGISLPQKEKLFSTLKTLASRGMTILFVTHKLEDVGALCTQVCVLRQGVLVGSVASPFSTEAAVSLMFGRELPKQIRIQRKRGNPVLEARSVGIDSLRLRLRDIDLELREGEILGLAGMEGSGQSLFLGACGGLVVPSAGSFCIDDDSQSHLMKGHDYHDFRKHGVAWLPASRMEEGLVPGMSLSEHSIIAGRQKGFFIDRKAALIDIEQRISEFRIKGKPETLVEALSGGNQQRTLLALLPEDVRLILIEHPTRGLDIESSAYIWSRLRERCSKGASVVFISSDLDEILTYSDRVLVFYAGRVSAALDADKLRIDSLGRLIGGAD